jgi:hypothetical protein
MAESLRIPPHGPLSACVGSQELSKQQSFGGFSAAC